MSENTAGTGNRHLRTDIANIKTENKAWSERLDAMEATMERLEALIGELTVLTVNKGTLMSVLNYTEQEAEQCFEDVPDLNAGDILYAKGILDSWDPETTTINGDWEKDTKLVIFPKIDTSNVTGINRPWVECRNLRYVPLLDTSNVVKAEWLWQYGEVNGTSCAKLKRMPSFDWSSLTSSYGLCSGLSEVLSVGDLSMPELASIGRLMNCNGNMKTVGALDIPMEIVTNAERAFAYCFALEHLPLTEFPAATNLAGLYSECYSLPADLSETVIRAPKAKRIDIMFKKTNIVHAPQIEAPAAEDMSNCFMGCTKLADVPDYSGIAPKTMNQMFFGCKDLERIGGLNFANVTSMSNMFKGATYICYMLIKNIGASELDVFDFSEIEYWGEDRAIRGSRQSLVDSLLTYSADRAAAGKTAATIKLGGHTISNLSGDEIAAIEAKGYVLTA